MPTVSKREPKRSRVFLSATVDAGHGLAEARIRDVSRSGALVESALQPEAGESVRLTCGAIALGARVAWAERGWFGVEFETPLLITSLVDPTGAKLAVSAPRAYRRADALD